ncbi:hypothetical protein TWF694_008270 [Orbilia ellipsospora]|uniref:Fe2OG dioxygenase domain-containing protein n=1 Tax=Orbilia ellipsospora TaxID=2528407 RepID=A0AAV9XFN6_9PEZI
MSKRSIASFFTKLPETSKKPRLSSPAPKDASVEDVKKEEEDVEESIPSIHPSYPHPILSLPPHLLSFLATYQPPQPRQIKKPDLQIDSYTPFFPPSTAKSLYLFLRASLPFYRVTYSIKRGDLETTVNTPRFTTVYGIDSHSIFLNPDSNDGGDSVDGEKRVLVDSKTKKTLGSERYRACVCRPRPIPQCLEVLKNIVERETGEDFNFVLVNYYASSEDSISYHSDDEHFLGPNPTIASLSLGTTRDFLLKHKQDKNQTLKLPLSNGEMVVMKGATQKKWLHSIPKRSSTVTGSWTNGGRINITFRKGVEIACTGNYYRYNVGSGPVYRWNSGKGEMEIWGDKSVKKAALGDGTGTQD